MAKQIKNNNDDDNDLTNLNDDLMLDDVGDDLLSKSGVLDNEFSEENDYEELDDDEDGLGFDDDLILPEEDLGKLEPEEDEGDIGDSKNHN
jgi:hypothetical protein